VVEHLFAVVTVGRDLSQPQERADIATEVLPTIGEISDPVVQAHYLQRLSRLARVSEDALRRQLPRRGSPMRRRETARDRDSLQGPSVLVAPRRAPREEFCLALLYQDEALAYLGQELDETLFSLSENRELLRRWKNGKSVSEEESELWEHQQTVLTTRIPQTETEAREAAFLDCVARLEQGRMRAVKEASGLALAEGEAGLSPGKIITIALQTETQGDAEVDNAAAAAASQLLEDTENGLRLFRRQIVGANPDQAESAGGR
jgi:DNA primase